MTTATISYHQQDLAPFARTPNRDIAQVAVEPSQRRDRIVTLHANGIEGESEVRWLGVQRLRAKALRDPRLLPVCIKAGALGERLPRVLFARQLPQPISDRLRGRAESLGAATTQASTPTAA